MHSALAQTPAPALKVFVSCASCDMAALKTAVNFAEIVGDEGTAEVSVALSSEADGSMQKWTMAVKGRGVYAGRDRTVTFSEESAKAAATVARYVKLGIAEFAAATANGARLDVGFRSVAANPGASPIAKDQKDPWNHWVYRLSASIDAGGEQSSTYSSHSFNGSANRVTENWRMRVSGNRNVNKSSFDLDEETTIKSDTTSWGVDTTWVKSLTSHWSAGFFTSTAGSTFSNQKLYYRATPGIEFDVFPYAESSRHSLTLQYNVGAARYDYRNLTIFDKLHETVVQHAINVSFGLRQPWGSVGAFSGFSQQLTALDRTRFQVNANGNIRLFKSLTLNANANYTRIRDQFTLEKGTASEEEVLLRLRQLATGYRYSFNIGFGYAFGALSNTTVNPRFGG